MQTLTCASILTRASIAYIGIAAPLMLYGLAYNIASKYTDLPVFYTEF